MASAISRTDVWNAEDHAVWERDGKRCARCQSDLPDFRDCRVDNIIRDSGSDSLRTLCVPCYVLRGDAKRWRTANIGALVAAGILPKNWRDFVWFDGETQSA